MMEDNLNSNDLEQVIKKLKEKVNKLEGDKEILKKDIDRLSEYSQNLERMMKRYVLTTKCLGGGLY